MQQQVFRVNQRLQIGSERATVRYIGEVAGQSGEWVGLEWDNAARGKHDGSTNGQRYFNCIYSGEYQYIIAAAPNRFFACVR